jgi:hypothetical protein
MSRVCDFKGTWSHMPREQVADTMGEKKLKINHSKQTTIEQ